MSAKRALAAFRAPDESGAEQRSWDVVRGAFGDRPAAAPRRSRRRGAGAFGAALLLAGALALSPAGATVGRLITRALGVRHASAALFSLPSGGKLLVSASGGTWTVAGDGSHRRLGPWSEASWSPHGIYVVVAGRDQLAAVDPRGRLQWGLARGDVRDPRWYGPTGYRVAYLSGGDLRVVAGDSSGDHLVAGGVAAVAPAWRPEHPYQLGFVDRRGRVVVRDGDTGQTLWSAQAGAPIYKLAWSADGRRLLALSRTGVRVYSGSGTVIARLEIARGERVSDGALSPDGRTVALVLGGDSGEVLTEALSTRSARQVLAGAGLGQVAWSPDGRWLLVSWPAANQWVFVRVIGTPRIEAVSRIRQQFTGGGRGQKAFPQLDGWCCTAAGAAG